MDIDATLQEIRELISKHTNDNYNFTFHDVDRLVELTNGLDMWLTKEGYPPKPWLRPDPLGRKLAKELLQTHKETGISLDKWRTARLFVERELFVEVKPNNV